MRTSLGDLRLFLIILDFPQVVKRPENGKVRLLSEGALAHLLR